jgi:hypothetical protein
VCGEHPLAAGDGDELLGGGHDRCLDLLAGIFDEALRHDVAHFIAEPGESSELVERTVAPQELVRRLRQLIKVAAKLESFLRTVIGEVPRDDASSIIRASTMP